jgi:hypothetical protein
MNRFLLTRIAERLMTSKLPSDSRDAILGDLQERFNQITEKQGRAVASLWYWMESIRTMSSFLLYSLETSTLRRQTVTGTFFYRERGWTALLSILFLLPALLIVIPGFLFEVFGKPVEASMNGIPGLTTLRAWADSPWMVLGGLGIVLLINFIAILRVDFKSSKQELQTILTWKRNNTSILFLLLAILVSLALLGYGVVENLLPLLTSKIMK